MATPVKRATYLDQIVSWLEKRPQNTYTPRQVAKGLELDVTKVATWLLHLHKQGRVTRYRNQAVRNGPGSSVYGANRK